MQLLSGFLTQTKRPHSSRKQSTGVLSSFSYLPAKTGVTGERPAEPDAISHTCVENNQTLTIFDATPGETNDIKPVFF